MKNKRLFIVFSLALFLALVGINFVSAVESGTVCGMFRYATKTLVWEPSNGESCLIQPSPGVYSCAPGYTNVTSETEGYGSVLCLDMNKQKGATICGNIVAGGVLYGKCTSGNTCATGYDRITTGEKRDGTNYGYAICLDKTRQKGSAICGGFTTQIKPETYKVGSTLGGIYWPGNRISEEGCILSDEVNVEPTWHGNHCTPGAFNLKVGKNDGNDFTFDFCMVNSTCDNGVDDDNDGLIDLNDAGCSSVLDDSEAEIIEPVPQQSDLCSTQNQTILSLYSETNSHGANATDPNYNVKICYDEIFERNYTGENPNSCTGSNLVLKLSSLTNAHAEKPSLTNYNTNICYGDLNSCRLASGTSCNSNEKAIVYLSGDTDAHLSKIPQTGYRPVCCSVGPQVGEAGLSWRNGNNQIISEAGLDWRVYLRVEQTGLPDGEVDLEIKRRGGGLLGGNSDIETVTGTAIGGVIEAEWDVNYEGIQDEHVLFFEYDGDESGDLFIDYSLINNPPVLNIISPQNGEVYFVNTPIDFEATCTDAEDKVEIIWDLLETNTELSNEDQFTHTFTSGGQKTFRVSCIENRDSMDSESSEKEVGILVVDGPGLFAFIKSPFHRETIINNDLKVNFDATGSYAINSEYNPQTCSGTITCLAGGCPTQTANIPSGCSGSASISGSPKGYGDLQFKWAERGKQGIFEFGKVTKGILFAEPGTELFATLDLKYDQDGTILQKSIEREFTLVTGDRCSADGNYYIDSENGEEVSRSKTTSPNSVSAACAGPNGIIGGGDDCCPSGYTCQDSGDKIECILVEEEPGKCEDYTTEETCNDDDLNRGKASNYQESQLNCGETIDGKLIVCGGCVWEPAGDSDGVCGLRVEERSQDNGPNGEACRVDNGAWQAHTVNKTACIDGTTQYLQTWTKLSTSTSTLPVCETLTPEARETKEFSGRCGGARARLDFFGVGNLIIVILVLFLIYSFNLYKNRHIFK